MMLIASTLTVTNGNVSVLAANVNDNILNNMNDIKNNNLIECKEKLSDMSVEELNDLIDNIAKTCSTPETRGVSVPTSDVELAWLAAAEIARKNGYPCSATLVEYSIKNINYLEEFDMSNGGLFQSTISKAPKYKNYVSKMKVSLEGLPEGIEFTGKDLFYSLHDVGITAKKIGSGSFATYNITITDIYNFDLERYDDLFTGLINNWAWLCQQNGVFHPISIKIYMFEGA